MNNKQKFTEMIVDLGEACDKNNLPMRLFPIRSNFSAIKDNITCVLKDINIDMVSLTVDGKEIDLYQKYFEDYNINNGILTVDFKYNKQKRIKFI